MRNTPEITRGEADLPSSRNVQWFFFALVVAAVVLIHLWRSPDVMLNGRFWAEEGTLWWEHARSHGVISNLLYVPDLAGYFMLNTNLSFVAASFLPIEIEPLAVTWLATLCAAMPALLYLLVDSGRWTLHRALVLAFLIVGAPVLEPEVFSNAINAQIFFGLGTVVVLVFAGSESRGRRLVSVYLLVAGLSGMYAAVMAPLFIGKAKLLSVPRVDGSIKRNLLSRSQPFWLHAVAVTTGLVIQFVVFSWQRLSGQIYSTKATKFPTLTEIERFVESNFHTLLGGRVQATEILVNGGVGSTGLVLIGSSLLAALVMACVAILKKDLRHMSVVLILAAYVITTMFVLVGFADAFPHSRYQVLPSALLGLLFLEIIKVKRDGTAMLIFVTALLALSTIRAIPDDSRQFITCAPEVCRPWSDQVREVESDERTIYQFWPFSGPWTVER